MQGGENDGEIYETPDDAPPDFVKVTTVDNEKPTAMLSVQKYRMQDKKDLNASDGQTVIYVPINS